MRIVFWLLLFGLAFKLDRLRKENALLRSQNESLKANWLLLPRHELLQEPADSLVVQAAAAIQDQPLPSTSLNLPVLDRFNTHRSLPATRPPSELSPQLRASFSSLERLSESVVENLPEKLPLGDLTQEELSLFVYGLRCYNWHLGLQSSYFNGTARLLCENADSFKISATADARFPTLLGDVTSLVRFVYPRRESARLLATLSEWRQEADLARFNLELLPFLEHELLLQEGVNVFISDYQIKRFVRSLLVGYFGFRVRPKEALSLRNPQDTLSVDGLARFVELLERILLPSDIYRWRNKILDLFVRSEEGCANYLPYILKDKLYYGLHDPDAYRVLSPNEKKQKNQDFYRRLVRAQTKRVMPRSLLRVLTQPCAAYKDRFDELLESSKRAI